MTSLSCSDPYYKTASQFLTQIQPWVSHRVLSPFGAKQVSVSLKTIQKVLVEAVYLIFYLSMTGQSCYLSKRLWVGQPKAEEAEVYMLLATLQQGEEKAVKPEKVEVSGRKKSIQKEESKRKREAEEKKQLRRFIQGECVKIPGEGKGEEKAMSAMQSMVELCLECYRESRAKGCILPTRFNEAVIKAEMDQFCYVYFSILKPKFHLFPDASALLRALEETRLFRENALVLRYSNHCLLTKLASNQKYRQELKALTEEFLQDRPLFLKDPKGKVAACQDMVEQFFKMLALGNVIALSVSYSDTQPPQDKSKQRVAKIIAEESLESRVFSISYNVEEVPYQFLTQQRLQILLENPNKPLPCEQLSPNRRISQMELRYWAAANQLEIKLLTIHPVRFQELDLVSGVLGSVGGVLPQVDFSFEEAPRRKTNDRCVTLRTTLQLHPKECPFLSMLEATDHLIACSLLLEPELRSKREAGEKRRTQLEEMVNYLTVRSKELVGMLVEQD